MFCSVNGEFKLKKDRHVCIVHRNTTGRVKISVSWKERQIGSMTLAEFVLGNKA